MNDSSLYGNQAYANRIDAFFDKVVAPLPDSIKLEIDRFLAKIQNKVIKDFTLLYLLNKYEHPMYMTHDEIFIHLADEYILKNRDNALLNEAAYFFIEAHSGDLKRLALFNEAPALSLPDKNGLYIDTQSLESDYLILFFYDHECDVCAGEAQTLETICREHQNVSVYAVDMNYDFQPFENSFINVSAFHSRGLDPTDAYCIENTPLIYVLDREKSIIAKKIKAEQIGLFLK